MKVGIQGIVGAFHEEAAVKWFGGGIDIHPCPDFPELLDDLVMGKCDRAVMALENTISGTMQQNLRLLEDRDLRIVGEVRMPIVQNLGVLPGVSIEDLREVRSHHMALNQCRRFFLPYDHIILVDAPDTALSARQIRQGGLRDVGCIASARAIALNGLTCLAADIADDAFNLTRFLMLERGRDARRVQDADMATVTLILPHQSGSLNAALTALFQQGISLSKVESMPIVGRPYDYAFVMDLDGTNADHLRNGLETLKGHAEALTLMGLYKRDKMMAN